MRSLTNVEKVLSGHVDRGSAPGVVALVAQGQDRQVFPLGAMSLAGAPPMERGSLFRIASMTKPITAVAAMMLIEEGKLRLEDPIDRLAPELANRRVLKRVDGPLDDVEPARRAITLEDVLTFRLGWGVLFAEDYPIVQATAGIPGFGMPDPTIPITPDEFMQRLGALPSMAQPGERWLYTAGSNVLGVLIARAAGQPLETFLAERILEPLGMVDTAFHVPPEKRDRLVTGYTNENGTLTLFDPPDGMYAKPPSFPAGDSGLVSTVDDFGTFARFMVGGTTPDGRRLLSARSLEAMKTNHLTGAQQEDGIEILLPGRGWGYGLGVWTQDSPQGFARGSYGWDGGFGTSWITDPSRDLTAILLTQRVFDCPDPPQIHKDFWIAVNAAVAA